MKKCFVIQPFDKGKFDKRFVDVFEPGIKDAGLEAYRIDNDPSVRVPIETIENSIQESQICFADITIDNPNVWYELGYAFACKKDVIMVCSNERNGEFPFDIRHRKVIKYGTDSTSDYESLKTTITKQIEAFLKNAKLTNNLHSAPLIDTEGLESHEIAMLVLLIENQLTPDDSVSVWNLQNEMDKAGYNKTAVSVGLRTLKLKGMVELGKDSNYNGEEFPICKLTAIGEDWILKNKGRLVFRNQKEEEISNLPQDDFPF